MTPFPPEPLEPIHDERLFRQLRFLVEIDRLKGVLRRTYLVGAERLENSAEHSWHLAVACMVLAEHADEPVDILRALKMVLVHDLVEIDAGDTYAYDPAAHVDKAEREQRAAERIFGLLPEEQGQEFHALWQEFEARETPEARFANALDRLIPLLHSIHTGGRSWRQGQVVRSQVARRLAPIREVSTALGEAAEALLRWAVDQGLLPDDTAQGPTHPCPDEGPHPSMAAPPKPTPPSG